MRRTILITLCIISSLDLYSQNWQNDINNAKELALKEDKPIVLVFQGSDWCAPCIKLEKEIWNSPEFINYAADHYILLKADFPKKKKNALDTKQQERNNKLAETYNTNGYFPYIVVLDKNGKVLGSTGYQKITPNEYINLLNSFNN
jgi:thioredoxin-related protein